MASMSPERRSAISAKVKQLWMDPEYRNHMSNAHQGQAGYWKGRRLNPGAIEKISAAKKGQPSPMLGKHHTPEARAMISAANTGRPSAMKGRHHTQGSREQMSKAHIGRTDSRTGKCHTAEARELMRLSRTGELNPRWGKHHSPRTKAQISATQTALWSNKEYKEKMIRSILGARGNLPTTPEREMLAILEKSFPNEWRYCGNGTIIIGGKNPDFINVNGRKTVIEVFGDYWHSEEKTGLPIDQHIAGRVAHFAAYGFRCAVIWEHETKNEEIVLRKIRETQ
jgi:G:T-mismatch repair DNA endonuclease (very short patch repair protein)